MTAGATRTAGILGPWVISRRTRTLFAPDTRQAMIADTVVVKQRCAEMVGGVLNWTPSLFCTQGAGGRPTSTGAETSLFLRGNGNAKPAFRIPPATTLPDTDLQPAAESHLLTRADKRQKCLWPPRDAQERRDLRTTRRRCERQSRPHSPN